MSPLTYLLTVAAVAAMMAGRVECFPQDREQSDVEVLADSDGGGSDISPGNTVVNPGRFGSFVGEVMASTDFLTVQRVTKKKEEEEGPRASPFVSGPAEASVGVGASLTFNVPAAVVPLPSN